MKQSVKRQIRSGLRLGGGLAVFLIAMLPLVDGLRRVVWAGPLHQLVWAEPIGWLELLVAATLFFATAQVWVKYLLGCMVFGAVKGFVLLITGGGGSPPLQVAELLLFVFASIVLLVGIILRDTPPLDRVALTLYVFSVAWRADKGLFMPDPSLVVGLTCLFVSWCVYYVRHHSAKKVAGAGPHVGRQY
ncbi:MAG: hypothetical protein WBL97_10975 [Candidatus Sulfotelmatobacter sp.]